MAAGPRGRLPPLRRLCRNATALGAA